MPGKPARAEEIVSRNIASLSTGEVPAVVSAAGNSQLRT